MSTTSAPGRSSSCCSCASRHSTKRTGSQRKGGLFLPSKRRGGRTTLMATNDDGVASIGETFDRLKSEDKIAFIPFVVAGDPNLEATEKALKILGTSLFAALFSLFSSFSRELVTTTIFSFFLSFFRVFDDFRIDWLDVMWYRVRAMGVRAMTSSSSTKTFRPKHHHTRSGNNTTQTAVLISSYMLIFFFSFS